MDIQNLIKDYLAGEEITALQKKYNFSGVGTLYYYLKKAGIPTRGKQVHYKNPFELESAERDYWLGWLFSDGCIVNDSKHAYVYLACLDYDILLKFKDFCGDRAKMNHFQYITPVSKEVKTMYKVVINSIELVNWFEQKFHIKGKKASTLNPDILISWDLLRGVLDGDGSFKRGVVLVSQSKSWIDKISKFYDDHDLHYTLVKDTAYRLGIYKKKDIKKVFHYLYDNASVYLARKKSDLARLAEEQSSEK